MGWRKLMILWREKEDRFLSTAYKFKGIKLSTKIRITAMIISVLALFEHLFFLTNSFYNCYQNVKHNNWTVDVVFNYCLKNQFDYMFEEFVNYKFAYGILIEALNVSFTLGWNFMELFVMMISIGLVTRFNQVNKRLIQ